MRNNTTVAFLYSGSCVYRAGPSDVTAAVRILKILVRKGVRVRLPPWAFVLIGERHHRPRIQYNLENVVRGLAVTVVNGTAVLLRSSLMAEQRFHKPYCVGSNPAARSNRSVYVC